MTETPELGILPKVWALGRPELCGPVCAEGAFVALPAGGGILARQSIQIAFSLEASRAVNARSGYGRLRLSGPTAPSQRQPETRRPHGAHAAAQVFPVVLNLVYRNDAYGLLRGAQVIDMKVLNRGGHRGISARMRKKRARTRKHRQELGTFAQGSARIGEHQN